MSTNFQNAINAGLGVAAGAATVKRAEARKAAAEEKKATAAKAAEEKRETTRGILEDAAKQAAEATAAKAPTVDEKKKALNKAEQAQLGEHVAANRAQLEKESDLLKFQQAEFKRNPSAETYGAMQQTKQRMQQARTYIDRDEARIQEAMQRSEKRNAARRAQNALRKQRMEDITGGEFALASPEFKKAVKELYYGTDKKK